MPSLHSSSSDQSRSQVHPGTQRRRILVYDDDKGMAVAFGTILRRAGYEVEVASHFDPALGILDHAPVDLLVADIVVPYGVNGFALARMARMKQPPIRVIYVSGYDIPAVTESGLGPVLRKPVSDELLLSEVQKALDDAAAP